MFNFFKSSLGFTKKILEIPFGFFIILMNLFFLVSFAGNVEFFTPVLIYSVITIFFLGALDRTIPLLNVTLREGLLKFLLTFIIGIVLLSVFNTNPYTAGFGLMALFYSLIVSINEDIIYVGIIPRYLSEKFASSGRGLAALIFALFHIPAYMSVTSVWYILVLQLVFAFLMNLVFQFIARDKRFGLPVTMGLHSIYDLFVLGLI